MPFLSEHSLLNVNLQNVHTIDTSSVGDLYSLWSVFSKTAGALEDGKRLENMSWRLWNRETFCCSPEFRSRSSYLPEFPPRAESSSIPALASSVETASSIGDEDLSSGPAALKRLDSCDRSRGTERHITPNALERIVGSIQSQRVLTPLSPSMLPLPAVHDDFYAELEEARPETPHTATAEPQADKTASQQLQPVSKDALESSTASSASDASRRDDRSSDSSSTAMSTHNIVRGFAGGVPSSYRSQTQLAQPTPILRNSPRNVNLPHRKKGAFFTLGASSGEDEGSLDRHMHPGSHTVGRSRQTKHPSFKEENLVTQMQDSPVFESDDEDDDDISDGAIEDDEDSSEWEDELGDGEQSEVNERDLFQRVDSRPNLTSRRSLLTTQFHHEGDRATALLNAARSAPAPALRRSMTATPGAPLSAAESTLAAGARQASYASSSTQHLSLSPRTTRRNMLSNELTESLRKNLLCERQHKNAALKRRHTAHDLKDLDDTVFSAGLGDIHTRGW